LQLSLYLFWAQTKETETIRMGGTESKAKITWRHIARLRDGPPVPSMSYNVKLGAQHKPVNDAQKFGAKRLLWFAVENQWADFTSDWAQSRYGNKTVYEPTPDSEWDNNILVIRTASDVKKFATTYCRIVPQTKNRTVVEYDWNNVALGYAGIAVLGPVVRLQLFRTNDIRPFEDWDVESMVVWDVDRWRGKTMRVGQTDADMNVIIDWTSRGC
jgi:hypothetical protein